MKQQNFNISRKLHGTGTELNRHLSFIKKLIILKYKFHFNLLQVSSYVNENRTHKWGTFDISLTSDCLIIRDVEKIKDELGFDIISAAALDGKIFILITERYDIK